MYLFFFFVIHFVSYNSIVSFSAGSAMGTMGILFPLVLPLAYTLSNGDEEMVMQSAAAVLAGSTFGNTCSPLADNTVLSSLSTGCDLVLHAKTMIPFTLLSFFVSLLAGTIPVSLGWYSPGVALLICIVVVVLFLFIFGKDVTHFDDFDGENNNNNSISSSGGDGLNISRSKNQIFKSSTSSNRGNDYEILS